MKYTKEWTELTRKMGYWVDLNDPYITFKNEYIETLWYLLGILHEKGYLYKGYTIVDPTNPTVNLVNGITEIKLNDYYIDNVVDAYNCVLPIEMKKILS